MAIYNQTLTLSALPAQPLIQIGLADAVFVTIWLVASIAFSLILGYLVSDERKKPTWLEFKTILAGARVLAAWYFLMAIDRWMCHDRTMVNYNYLVFLPLREIFRISSTILLLWGNHAVIWRELQDRFSRPLQRAMWFTSKCGIFILTFLSIFYLVLGLALPILWLDFPRPTVIVEIASKKNSIEVAMNAFYTVFSLLTLVEAAYALTLRTVKVHGMSQQSRVFFLVAATLMFIKSLTAFGMVARVAGTQLTRWETRLSTDVSDGLLTSFYLADMCFMSCIVASPHDLHGEDARLIASDVRRYILRFLEARTNGARAPAPPFERVLRDVEERIDELLAEGPFCRLLSSDKSFMRASVLACLNNIRDEFGGFGGNAEFIPPHQTPFSRWLSLFSPPFRFGMDFGSGGGLGDAGGGSSVTLIPLEQRNPERPRESAGTRGVGPSLDTNKPDPDDNLPHGTGLPPRRNALPPLAATNPHRVRQQQRMPRQSTEEQRDAERRTRPEENRPLTPRPVVPGNTAATATPQFRQHDQPRYQPFRPYRNALAETNTDKPMPGRGRTTDARTRSPVAPVTARVSTLNFAQKDEHQHRDLETGTVPAVKMKSVGRFKIPVPQPVSTRLPGDDEDPQG